MYLTVHYFYICKLLNIMYLRLIFAVIILTSLGLKAQTYEAGIVIGGTNFVGDVGSKSFIKPKDYASFDKLSAGVIFKWNRSPRHAFRFSYIKHQTFGKDELSNSAARKRRDLSFFTDINEFALGLEFNFWEWDLHSSQRPQIVPYISTGVNFFITDHFIRSEDENLLQKQGKNNNFALPMVIGVKTTITEKLILAAEFGARYTFSDNLDGSNPQESIEIGEEASFGNQNMNDWYIFGGLTLTYTFGRKPCYCNF